MRGESEAILPYALMGRVPSASRGSGACAASPRANARAIPPAATARAVSEETATAPAPNRSVAVAARARRVARERRGARSTRASTPREAASRSVARRGAPSAPGACIRKGFMASRGVGTREDECGELENATGCYSGVISLVHASERKSVSPDLLDLAQRLGR